MTTIAMEDPKVVSEAEWLAARLALLAKEKDLTRARDAVSAERRKLPWVKVEKEYVFDTASGKRTLAELFDGRSQLIVYHFMWRHDLGAGCVGCSFLCDHIDGANQHLSQHDVTLVASIARTARSAAGIQAANGLALSLGLVLRERLQLRLSRLFSSRGTGKRQSLL